jgi:hypothetical protein
MNYFDIKFLKKNYIIISYHTYYSISVQLPDSGKFVSCINYLETEKPSLSHAVILKFNIKIYYIKT